jgi:hypothetical protein
VSRFIVMDRTAQVPGALRKFGGRYRRLAVVETDLAEGEPSMISERARGVIRIVRIWEQERVGKTDRSAYRIALAAAKEMADALNAKEARS